MASKTDYLKYIAALLLFGSNGIVARQISLASSDIVLLRTLIGSLLLMFLFRLGSHQIDRTAGWQSFLSLALSSIAMGASWIFLYEAYRQIGVGIASLTYYTGPVIVMVLSPWLFRERLTVSKLTGFAAVLGGVLLLNLPAIGNGRTGWGLLCGIMSAILYAIMVIFSKKAHGITGMGNAMLQLTASFLTVAVYTGFRHGFHLTVVPGDWFPILILGLINTGIGCYLYFSSIGRLPVQSVAIFGYLEPLSAVVFSILFLHEILQPVQLLGASLIIGGAMFAEGLLRKTGVRN